MMEDVKEIIDSLDGEELCGYCQHSFDGCKGRVIGSPNGPIFPPCSDGFKEEWFDLESYLEDHEDEEV